MLSNYANQVIGWKKRVDTGSYGQPVFDSEQAIRGRFEYKRRLVRNVKGEEAISEALLMTKTPVSIGDALVYDGREWTVLTVSPIIGLLGNELHREVYV